MSVEPGQSIATKSGVSIPWATLIKVLTWALPIIASAVMFYLSSVFVTQAQMNDAVAPMVGIPGRVEKLEEFKKDQRDIQSATNINVNSLQQDMAGIKAELRALQREGEKNTDRILQRLDAIQSGKN